VIRALRSAAALGAGGAQLLGAVSGAYCLVLLAGAARGVPAPPPVPDRRRFTVLVPAHDEEDTLHLALDALAAVDYPADDYEVVVIADNCSDATAEVARRHGARVLERRDETLRGKGYALRWALERLDGAPDVVTMVDADCAVTPNYLDALNRHFAAGAQAIQVDYRVANPADSDLTSLRNAGYLLHITVRKTGRTALGLSAGLVGTGMAFRRDVLEAHPWRSFGLTEDREQHFRLVLEDVVVTFVPEAAVVSAMPTRPDVARSQQMRWEADRLRLVQEFAGRLLAEGIARRDPVRIESAFEALVPPQAGMALLNLAGLGLGVAAWRRGLVASGLATVAMQAAYVLGGLQVADAPPDVYRRLLRAPGMLGQRVRALAEAAASEQGGAWVRTARS
jgi:hypothetical protein